MLFLAAKTPRWLHAWRQLRRQIQPWPVHSKLVLLCFSFTILQNTLFGLLLSRYFNRRRKFGFSLPVAIFCVAVASFFTAFYVSQILEDYAKGKLILRDAIKLYCYMYVCVCLLLYINQWGLTWDVSDFLNHLPIFETLNYFSMELSSVWRALTVALVKLFVFPLVLQFTLILEQRHSRPELSWTHTSQTLLPLLIGNQLVNGFYGSLVITKVVTSTINKQLLQVLQEVNLLQTPQQLESHNPYYRMRRFCELADVLDELAIKYTLTTKHSMGYMRLVDFSIVCYLLVNLIGITVGFFNLYQALAEHYIDGKPYDVFEALIQLVFLVLPFAEVMMLSRVSNHILGESRKTGNLLQLIDLQHADVRFQQVVESFWLQVCSIKYKLLPLGLLELDVSLVNRIFAAVASFLLILVQTDLAMRFSLKIQ